VHPLRSKVTMATICNANTKKGTCSRTVKEANTRCWQHCNGSKTSVKRSPNGVVSAMAIGDTSLFDADVDDPNLWEEEYVRIMDNKYAKGTRKSTIVGKTFPNMDTYGDTPPIFVVPRERGGPSFKEIPLAGVENGDVVYCPISKGYPMQDISSFTLGPIVGDGLCLVNAAFSKGISVFHIEGGGVVDFKRKTFWRRAKKPFRKIRILTRDSISVDGVEFNSIEWLKENEALWMPKWILWSHSVAMASTGSFHWDGDEGCVAYWAKGDYLDFVSWKKRCYIAPALELLPSIKVYQTLEYIHAQGHPLGLVHPKGRSNGAEKAITLKQIKRMMESPTDMLCMPYVVAGALLGLKVE
jgi:hypothetical protein